MAQVLHVKPASVGTVNRADLTHTLGILLAVLEFRTYCNTCFTDVETKALGDEVMAPSRARIWAPGLLSLTQSLLS